MQITVVETSFGPVPVAGALDGFSMDRPLLLVIRGAFPLADSLVGLVQAFPHVDVAFLNLPGMLCPNFPDGTLAMFAAAFDEVIADLFPDRSIVVLGLSMGGVVALSLRSPAVRSIVGVDPALSTAGLWPIRDYLLGRSAEGPALAAWIWSVFGLREGEWVNRDYRPVLEGLAKPTYLLLGAEPLEPERPFTIMPSLVSEADRALYRANRWISGRVVSGAGHDIPVDGGRSLVLSLRQALDYKP